MSTAQQYLWLTKKKVSLLIGDFLPNDNESPLQTHIAIAVSKGDKMDLIVQKCTELGATSISPVITDRSDVKLNDDRWGKKVNHWKNVSISACEQCGRNKIPEINKPEQFSKWINAVDADTRCIFHTEGGTSLKSFSNTGNIVMAFGSEGGFSDNEIKAALERNFRVVSLGARILRSETAPLSALAIVQSKWGDMDNL